MAEAAEQAGVRRFIQISAMGAGQPPQPGRDEVWAAYINAKSAAEEDLLDRPLHWTILRPGGLTDAPATGKVRLAAPRISGRHDPPRRRRRRSLPPCWTNRVPGTRYWSWLAETPRSPRLCTAFRSHRDSQSTRNVARSTFARCRTSPVGTRAGNGSRTPGNMGAWWITQRAGARRSLRSRCAKCGRTATALSRSRGTAGQLAPPRPGSWLLVDRKTGNVRDVVAPGEFSAGSGR